MAEGTYRPDQGSGKTAGDRTASFSLVNGVGMYWGFYGGESTRAPLDDPYRTILIGDIGVDEGSRSLRVVVALEVDASTVMNGFRITMGNPNIDGTDGIGGGMYNSHSSPTLTNYPEAYGLTLLKVMESTGATPYTLNWYYQPEWGWLWTNRETFPYVYRSSTEGKTSGWLYFKEGSADPILYHEYATKKWVTLE